ncbi:hypothetical protein F5887DRAFT_1286375 [Amanita rubescens]|nr:hypothetical protein F5887DRAFT_1286375 [Amanita rubescens]
MIALHVGGERKGSRNAGQRAISITTAWQTSSLPPPSMKSNESRHLCTRVLEGLLYTTSREDDAQWDTFQDLVKVLERALSVASHSTASSRCIFCPFSPDIVRITDRIQTKYRSTTKDLVPLPSTQIRLLGSMRANFMEDLTSDCRTLKELLRSIMDARETSSTIPPFLSSAGILDKARDVQINGTRFTNVAGNSALNYSSSNMFVFIEQESGIRFRSVLILLILAFLLFRLL